MQAKSDSNLWGIDVSRWQGLIDWPKVAAAGVQFAFVKATDGIGWTDPQFRRNAGGANAVGIPVGFYHFAHPETNSAAAEAEAFTETVKGLPVDLPYVLDLEGEAVAALGREKLTVWADTWLREVQRRTDHPVMLYTGAAFARSYCGEQLAKYPLWVAHYGTDQPMSNSTWEQWSVFQYSDKGSCDGIEGDVDMNLMELDFWKEVTGQVDKKTDFPDVEAGRWSENCIAAVSAAGIMTGYEDGTFRPDQPVTREELAKVLNDMLYLINQR